MVVQPISTTSMIQQSIQAIQPSKDICLTSWERRIEMFITVFCLGMNCNLSCRFDGNLQRSVLTKNHPSVRVHWWISCRWVIVEYSLEWRYLSKSSIYSCCHCWIIGKLIDENSQSNRSKTIFSLFRVNLWLFKPMNKNDIMEYSIRFLPMVMWLYWLLIGWTTLRMTSWVYPHRS